ncbi:MAG: beta-eliminating lyase-related protein [Christensenellales bacterium]|nr:beta-eliminating lyase-related protein [Christensenellales bacterium]
MIRFGSDYQEGAHPRILNKLFETNLEQTTGYGMDEYCEEARRLILKRCAVPKAEVHFLVGGTQTNFTFFAAVLRPHQGVIAADTGHIAVHETGAVEACGHKVIALPGWDGKLKAAQVSEYCRIHFEDEANEHMVMPGAVYISNPTELGTVYTREEIRALKDVCRQWNLILYLDGARLGYGLVAAENDMDLPFLAENCDAFYIGGTKQGLLFGEALVIIRKDLQQDFRYILKQKGGMLAKGRLLGIQFAEMMRDELYFEISRHGVELAQRLRKALTERGYSFLVDSPTNQLFPIMPDSHLEALQDRYAWQEMGRVDDSSRAVRFCTSWATQEEDIEALIQDIRGLKSLDE